VYTLCYVTDNEDVLISMVNHTLSLYLAVSSAAMTRFSSASLFNFSVSSARRSSSSFCFRALYSLTFRLSSAYISTQRVQTPSDRKDSTLRGGDLTLWQHCCHMGTAIKHPVPDWVKLSFVIFDIQTLWRSALSVRVPRCRKLQMTAEPSLAQDAL